MIMNNDLLFLSGNDIPFIEAQITIHQPRIREIAYIGEENFFTGCELINFSKNILSEQDKINLKDKTNFDILIAILKERNAVMQKNRNCLEMTLALFFPEYMIYITEKGILLEKDEEKHLIDNNNFEIFKNIINQIVRYKKDNSNSYNPQGNLASKIAEKLNKRHQKLAELKKEEHKKINILVRYVSILAVGEKKDMNELFNYSIYQLYDEFERYQLKMSNDAYIKAKLAGAKDLKEVEDWMKDIHS